MPAIAPIIIFDGETTPVARTYDPAKSSSDYVLFENRVNGIYSGFEKLSVALLRPKGNSNVGNRNIKLIHRLEIPVMEVLGNASTGITPPPTVAYRPAFEGVFTIPERATKQQRKNLRMLVIASITHATLGVGAVDDLSIPW